LCKLRYMFSLAEKFADLSRMETAAEQSLSKVE